MYEPVAHQSPGSVAGTLPRQFRNHHLGHPQGL